MRPASYSDESIIEAGKVILARGGAVNGFSLRKQLGGGNPARLLLVWEKSRETQTLDSESVIPEEISDIIEAAKEKLGDTLSSLIVDAYSHITRVAAVDLEELRVEFQQAKVGAQADAEQFGSVIDDLEGELQALRAERDALARSDAMARTELAVSASQLAMTSQRLEELRGQNEMLLARLDALSAQLQVQAASLAQTPPVKAPAKRKPAKSVPASDLLASR